MNNTKMSDIFIDYMNYLDGIVHISSENPLDQYTKLASTLLDIEFFYTLPLDENRVTEAMELRTDFLAEVYGITSTEGRLDVNEEAFLSRPMSVLEVMVALAKSCEDRIMYIPGQNRTHFWFHLMLENLGFEGFADGKYSDEIAAFVEEHMEEVLNRDYDFYGEGGFWPCYSGQVDAKTVDMWMQMNRFLVENGYY